MLQKVKRILIIAGITLAVLVGITYLVVYGLYFSHPNPRKPVGETLSYMKEIRAALELYKNEHQTYPQDLRQLVPTIYERTLPTNKVSSGVEKPFVYTQTENGEGYSLCATILTPDQDMVVDANHQYCETQSTQR
jgi:type II secretory pathway pseudopilin PulG